MKKTGITGYMKTINRIDGDKKERAYNILLFFIIALGALIRAAVIGDHRLHGDEALYAFWAVDIAKNTGFILSAPFALYKPPVFLYLAALSYSFFPIKEVFSMLPNIIAGIFSIYLVFKTAEKIFDKETAFAAALIFALSPVNILFSATAFMDTLMVMFALWAAYFLIEKRYMTAGLMFGLALGTKQFAVFFIPFYLYLIFYAPGTHNIRRMAARGLQGFGIGFLFPLIWGAANSLSMKKPVYYFLNVWFGSGDRPEVFRAAVSFSDIISRAGEWIYIYNMIFVFKWISIVFLIFIAAALIRFKKKYLGLAAAAAVVFAATTVSQMPIFDRYVVTFAPVIILLCAASLAAVLKINTNVRLISVLLAILILFLALPVRKGIFKYQLVNQSGQTLGASYSVNDGVDQIARYILLDHGKTACVAFHPDFSWTMDYYLYGAPEGYCWYYYSDIDAASKGFRDTSGGRINFIMFYADNNMIEEFEPYLSKYGMNYHKEYSVFNRFGKENIILYRINPGK
ncbi:MAG: ArnT family glycosyltransferase [Candidatus Goldiibacteriota bacterium]